MAQESRPPTEIPWWNTDLGEEAVAAASSALRARHVTAGEICRELESRLASLLGIPHVVTTTSGSAAILLGLQAVGVRPGDEVIVPAAPFIAAAHAVQLLGARVVLVDVEVARPVVEPGAMETAITDRTRAIIAIHPNGAAADIDAVNDIARAHGLAVVEDAAQAFLSQGGKGPLGTRGDVGAFSMGITKLITSGEGGFVATRDDGIAEKLRRLRNHGTRAIAENRFEEPGFNLRLTDLQASIVLPQIDRIDDRLTAVREVYAFYREALAGVEGIELMPLADGELPLWTQAISIERERLLAHLAEGGIDARPYHPCLAESPHLKQKGEFPNACRFAREALTLPSGTHRTPQELAKVAAAIIAFVRSR